MFGGSAGGYFFRFHFYSRYTLDSKTIKYLNKIKKQSNSKWMTHDFLDGKVDKI